MRMEKSSQLNTLISSKYYILLLVVFMTIVAGGCKKRPEPIVITPDIEKNHLQRNHIFGTVKTLETETYDLSKDSLSLKDTTMLNDILKNRKADITTLQTFSSDGYLLKFYKLGADKVPVLHQIYRYDNDAKLNNWDEYDSTNQTTITGLCLYNRHRWLIGEQFYHGDSIFKAVAYNHDGAGNIINSTQSFNNYITHTKYKYNENGLVDKITEYEPNGRVFKNVKIEYDNYGDEVNRCVYKSGNQMIEYTYTQYDQEGRLTKIIYEDRIHHIKEIKTYPEHDDQYNWTLELKVVDNQITSIRKRKIIYY